MKIVLVLLLIACTVYAGGQPPSGCYFPSQCNPGSGSVATLAEHDTVTTLNEDEEVVQDVLVQFSPFSAVSSFQIIPTPASGIWDHPQGCIGGCVSLTQNSRSSVFRNCNMGYIFFSKINGTCPTAGDFVSNTKNYELAVEACRNVVGCQAASAYSAAASLGSMEMFGTVTFAMLGGQAQYRGFAAENVPPAAGVFESKDGSDISTRGRLMPQRHVSFGN